MKLTKRLFALLLTICLLVTGTVVVYAEAEEEEIYLADIRIVYAKNYEEAQKVLQNTEFKNYKLLNYNLNATAAKVDLGLVTVGGGDGVFLAYKTTTNVDEAITDIAIMQMNGGYREGNYLEMVQNSRKQYEQVGNTYRTAINYMIEAYYAGNFLATAAYRQLELYYDDDHKMTLGAFFETQPGADALATMFLEGNRYAIENVRSLIGMGVSYNDDGLTYLEKVSEAAAEMDADSSVYEYEGYEDLAETVSGSIVTFREMLRELAAFEKELNFEDDTFTDTELKYAEHQALAEMFRKVDYLNDKTLYDFCYDYYKDDSDFSSLYPLVHALNEGQKAITTAGNYYDAVRYSMSEMPEDFMNEEIAKAEQQYGENPFSIYTGVDRSIYKNTFALTNDAYRADVSSDKGFFESVYGASDWKRWGLEIAAGATGTGLFVWAILRTKNWISNDAAAKAFDAALQSKTAFHNAITNFKFDTQISMTSQSGVVWEGSAKEFVDDLLEFFPTDQFKDMNYFEHTDVFVEKVNYLKPLVKDKLGNAATEQFDNIVKQTQSIVDKHYPADGGVGYGDAFPKQATATGLGSKLFTVGLYAVGAAMMAYAAYSYGSQIVSYYNPDYKDIPTAMIDLIVTESGDRYIKYDAATMVTVNEKTKAYDAADLNAFEGQRWNALYFTKSYEAGKPLLASPASFKVVTNNNVAPANHLAVHRFGESVCYDLNKYNFEYEDSIYLSIAQSETKKSAVEEVPDIIGSILSGGLYFLLAGAGIALGVFGTLGTQLIIKKKKASKGEQKTDEIKKANKKEKKLAKKENTAKDEQDNPQSDT